MKRTLDLTHEMFDLVDFSEATISEISLPDAPSKLCRIRIWGVTLLTPTLFPFLQPLFARMSYQPTQGAYLSGYGTLTLNNVIDFSYDVALYRPDGKGFLTDADAKIQRTSIRGSGILFNPSEAEYGLQCVTLQPFGYCSLEVNATESVWFTFDDRDSIDMHTFIMNPNIYSLLGQGKSDNRSSAESV